MANVGRSHRTAMVLVFGFCLISVSRFISGVQQGSPLEVIESGKPQFVLIRPGVFWMGCDDIDGRREGNECYNPYGGLPPDGHSGTSADESSPRHQVAITKSFEMGKYEVTHDEWLSIMGENPSHFVGDKSLPVDSLSWNDIQTFLDRMNGKNDGYRYRLPTEAEWEYAARAGVVTTIAETGSYRCMDLDFKNNPIDFFTCGSRGPFVGPRTGTLDAKAWYSGTSGGRTHAVGQKSPNAWGLFDMLGNVAEYVQDHYQVRYYAISPGTDPSGPAVTGHILRGGSWNLSSHRASVWYREFVSGPESRRLAWAGIRYVRVPR